MDVFSAFLTGIGDAFLPSVLLAVLIGSVIATILGVIPVLAGGLAIVLLMPYLYGMDPLVAMPLLLALDAVSCTGGSMTRSFEYPAR
jgi:TctA family transporter